MENANDEFASLDYMEKAKMIVSVGKSTAQIKTKCGKIQQQMDEMKSDFENVKKAAEDMEQGLQKAQEDGLKCHTNNKKTIKDCYEFIYEPIKAPTKKKKEVPKCCAIF